MKQGTEQGIEGSRGYRDTGTEGARMDTREQGMHVEGECRGRMRSRKNADLRRFYSAIGYIYRERS